MFEVFMSCRLYFIARLEQAYCFEYCSELGSLMCACRVAVRVNWGQGKAGSWPGSRVYTHVLVDNIQLGVGEPLYRVRMRLYLGVHSTV
jgi:hypothetical protein